MKLPHSLLKAKVGDVIKCVPAGCKGHEVFFYAIVTDKDDKMYQIDNGDKRENFFLAKWWSYFEDIFFVRSNQLLLKTINLPEVLLFIVDEQDNVLDYNAKIPVRNPYFTNI